MRLEQVSRFKLWILLHCATRHLGIRYRRGVTGKWSGHESKSNGKSRRVISLWSVCSFSERVVRSWQMTHHFRTDSIEDLFAGLWWLGLGGRRCQAWGLSDDVDDRTAPAAPTTATSRRRERTQSPYAHWFQSKLHATRRLGLFLRHIWMSR